MQHVVQGAAREENVVDGVFVLEKDPQLQDPEAAFQDAKKTLHVLANTLQCFAPPALLPRFGVLARGDEDPPLIGAVRSGGENM